jgi:hypothetical protein
MKRIIVGILLVLSLACGSLAAEQPNLPTNFDVIMLAGADYSLMVMIRDNSGTFVNMSSPSYSAQFRSAAYPAGTIFANFSAVRKRNPLTDKMAIELRLSKAQTNTLSGKSGVWDLKETGTTGLVSYILTGKAAVRPTVTR